MQTNDSDEGLLPGEQAGLVYVKAPCPKCHATTEDEAGRICQPTCDETGERICPGEFKDGISVQPTPESIAKMDAWIDEQVAQDQAAEELAARRRATARGHKNLDELIVCRGGHKQPVWMFYLAGHEPLPTNRQYADGEKK